MPQQIKNWICPGIKKEASKRRGCLRVVILFYFLGHWFHGEKMLLSSHCGLFWVRLSSPYICCTLGVWLIFCYMILGRNCLQENFILLALGTGKESKNNVQVKYTSFFLPDAQDREISPLSSRFPEYPWEWMSITAHETGSSKAAPG